MLEYDLLYGSETRPILSVGFFFFHRTWDCPGDEVEPHPDWSPLGVQFYFFCWASPSLPTPSSPPPPPPLPPPPPSPGDVQRFTDYNEIHVNNNWFNMGCLFIIRWKKVLSQSHTRSTDDLLLPVRDAQWSFFIFDSSPSLGPRVKSK